MINFYIDDSVGFKNNMISTARNPGSTKNITNSKQNSQLESVTCYFILKISSNNLQLYLYRKLIGMKKVIICC